MKTLYLGCTEFRHQQIGINAVVNARAGLQCLNNPTIEDVEMLRDARKVREKLASRTRFYQFNSKAFRRNLWRLGHLISSYEP